MRFPFVVVLLLVANSGANAQSLVGTGDDSCRWGSQACNRCVPNVESQFKSFDYDPNGRFTFWSGAGRILKNTDKPMLPFSAEKLDDSDRNKGHIQGFARIPGLADNNWFVYSMDTSDPGDQLAGLVFTKMPTLTNSNPSSQGGHHLAWPGQPDLFFVTQPATEQAGAVFSPVAPIDNPIPTRHPGGLQMIGQIVATANFGVLFVSRANVTFMQGFRTSDDLLGVGTVDSFELPSAKETPFHVHMSNRKAYALAITKLSNGHYLMMVNRSDYGHMQYFVSTMTEIVEANDWIETNVDDTSLPVYQNLSFVNECDTRQIYLLAARQKPKWTGPNYLHIYKVLLKGDDYDTGPLIAEVEVGESGDTCESKGGSSFYVTPSGRLVFYCSQGVSVENGRNDQDPLLLSFAEHVASDEHPCLPADGAIAVDRCREDIRQPKNEQD